MATSSAESCCLSRVVRVMLFESLNHKLLASSRASFVIRSANELKQKVSKLLLRAPSELLTIISITDHLTFIISFIFYIFYQLFSIPYRLSTPDAEASLKTAS